MRVLAWVLVVTSVLAGAVFAQESAQGTQADAQPSPLDNAATPAINAPDTPSTQPSEHTQPSTREARVREAHVHDASVHEAPVNAVRLSVPPEPAAARAAAAPPATPSGPSIVLVMESSGGLRAASELRAALTQVGYRVQSAAEAQRKATQPDVLLTVAFTPPAPAGDARGGARGVHIAYWGRDGQTDSLTAASLATLDQLNAVALALSSALIDRHRNDEVISATDNVRARLLADPRGPAVLYAMVSATPRTNVRLRVEDF
jgi:hypothetical protein